MSDVEQAYIELVLKHTKTNRTRAAEILGISLRTLQNVVRETPKLAERAAASESF